MSDSTPKDLRHAEELRREGKLQEALKIITDIEKKGPLTPKDQLTLLISKGKILTIYQRHDDAVKVGKLAYRLSLSLGKPIETIYSLILRANSLFLGQYDKALNYLFEAESILNSLSDVTPSYLARQRKNILFRKSYAYFYKGDFNKALEIAVECLELQEKYGSENDVAYTLQLLGSIYVGKYDFDLALNYTSRSLTMLEKLGDQVGLATSLMLMGGIYYREGKLDQAVKYNKKSLSIKINSPRARISSVLTLGDIYQIRGELDKALNYYKQGFALAEEENNYDYYITFQAAIGGIYSQKGEYDLAIEFLEPSLSLAEKTNNLMGIFASLPILVKINLKKGAYEEVQKYLERYERLEAQLENEAFTHSYQVWRAAFLIEKGGTRNRAEAERWLTHISNEETQPNIKLLSLIFLCEFYLEELNLFEDIKILEELNPLIERLYKISEEQRMYRGLAEAKLLQAKVTLIQFDFEETQRLLVEAQRIAELYGIVYLAQKISSEHDNYLEKLSEWKNLKEGDFSISERLKLAEVDDVLERLQGKRAIDPPELVDEQPTLLLIIAEGGVLVFSHPFTDEWKQDNSLFSSFLSAFTSFSDEFFSEGLDRVKFGRYTVLMESVGSFSVCYLYKGQTYAAKQKLSQFTEAIQNTSIWQTLEKSFKTSQSLELKDSPLLESFITDIFIKSL
ncbi:MAG: tetratricopeptide repeat protein [Promethearchaeota archaeon]|jgi:tetratricopeptide (TPR) repeat protein